MKQLSFTSIPTSSKQETWEFLTLVEISRNLDGDSFTSSSRDLMGEVLWQYFVKLARKQPMLWYVPKPGIIV